MRINRLCPEIRLVLLALFLVSLFPVMALGDMVCSYCGKPITQGNYIQVDGKYYHADHFLCGKCGKSIGAGQYYTEDGKYICTNCYEKYYRPVCAWCGKGIAGRYIEQNGKIYHADCYNENVAPQCRICGRAISGEYLKDYWGNYYCISHRGELDECDYCGRFISKRSTGGGTTYRDGRHVCGYCLQNAVSDKEHGRRILEEVAGHLKRFGIEISFKGITLYMVDKPTLVRIAKSPNGNHTGFVKYEGEGFLGITTKQKFDIYILEGMPLMDFIQSAAHELMHVWQYSNKILDNDAAWCEGSCNYAAFLVLGLFNDDHAGYLRDNMEKSPDPIYGEGFRRVKRLAEQKGNQGWLRLLKESINFPTGY